MYYALLFYPQLSAKLSESINAIRRQYDPTCDVVKPHVTVLFPVPGSIGEGRLIRHIENVLTTWSPFVIRLGGLLKSHDHWLFLTLKEGEARMKQLYQALYTGFLAEHRREYVPHLGLGLFIKKGVTHNWRNPRESDFDRECYEQGLRQAKALPLSSSISVEKLQFTTLPDVVIEWARGKTVSIPEDSHVVEVRTFRLGHQGA